MTGNSNKIEVRHLVILLARKRPMMAASIFKNVPTKGARYFFLDNVITTDV